MSIDDCLTEQHSFWLCVFDINVPEKPEVVFVLICVDKSQASLLSFSSKAQTVVTQDLLLSN